MARLPEPGGDSGQWGDVLNEYLKVSHNNDGTLKNGSVSANTVQDNTITVAKISTPAAPTSGQALTYNGTNLAWATVSESESVSDATPTAKGVVQLAGDLSGTAASPTVPGLATKEPKLTAGTTTQYYRGDKSWQTLDKTAVGLANVDNTADSAKPISSATQTALNGKANIVHTHAGADITSGTVDGARLPSATESTKGAVQLASVSEAVAGTDTVKAVTAAGVAAAVTAVANPVIFVNSLSEIPPGTPVDTLVIVRAA